MLVLTRKVGDVIAIGDNIKIVVMAIKGKQVRLGIQADRSTVVHREEIYQKIQQEVKAALQSDVHSTTAAGDLLKTASDGRPSQPSSAKKTSSQPPQLSGSSGASQVLKTKPASAESDDQPESTPPSKPARVIRKKDS